MVVLDASPSFLSTVFSTVTSPLFLDVAIYWGVNVDRVVCIWSKLIVVKYMLPENAVKNAPRHQQRSESFREMYRVREF